ncbi:MAG: bifunctional tetrahydrofolate synthase/dihydrofolate synthase [Burkholderiaceae bacterium]|nr:bifunctional tetrahydrofolate synthase/dihydrofolate synthase [Burkholderiaceae bacterium]
MNTLDDWLGYIERIHHRPIDMTLDRVREVAQRLHIRFDCPVIIVGGTNGKGSTCAMLDSMLRAGGYRTGLYTSPHLLRFNERVQINGELASDEALTEHLAAVEAARGEVSLTYFEFTTLAILRLLSQAKLDAAVLEIGLGGRLDAVNIVDADVSIVTSIDLDHMEFLGPTREHIGFEKAHIYRAGRPAICSDPQPPQSLIDVANRLGADLRLFGRDFNYAGLDYGKGLQQWSYGGRSQRRASLPYPALRGANQLLNASAALAALECLADRLPLSQQAIRTGLLTVEIPGRFQVLPGQPAVILDVAHNPHAAAVLAHNLDSQGFYPETHAVFGMLADKDVAGVIARVKSRIDHWHVGPTPGARGLSAAQAATALRAAGVTAISEHDTLAAAYAHAAEQAQADARIVVFGSFTTVAAVMLATQRQRESQQDPGQRQ